MTYDIRQHSAYVSVWRDGRRIAKVPIQDTAYGLPPAAALNMARRIVAGLTAQDAGARDVPQAG